MDPVLKQVVLMLMISIGFISGFCTGGQPHHRDRKVQFLWGANKSDKGDPQIITSNL